MTSARLNIAKAAMEKKETKISELCRELNITRQTLYRFVIPAGELCPDAIKLLDT